MSQRLYKEWFVNFKFPGHETAKFVDSPLGMIPEGWRVEKIKNLCDSINYGFTASAIKESDSGKPRFLRITDIVPEVINWENVPFCEISLRDTYKYQLKEGDIVIARTGATTGFAKRLNKWHPKAVFASYLVRITPKRSIGKHLLGIAVESLEYKEFVKKNLGGSAQPQANAQVLTSMDAIVPTPEIIEKFDVLIESLIDQKELLQLKNTNLRKTRDMLLPKLISGELDVEELDIDTGEAFVES